MTREYEFAIAALRLRGLLAGKFSPTWAGEIWWLLGEVHGAGE